MKELYISSEKRYNNGKVSPCGWVDLDKILNFDDLKDFLHSQMDVDGYDEELCILDDNIQNADLRRLLRLDEDITTVMSRWEAFQEYNPNDWACLATLEESLYGRKTPLDDLLWEYEHELSHMYFCSLEDAVQVKLEHIREVLEMLGNDYDINLIDMNYLRKKVASDSYEGTNGIVIVNC